MSRKRTSPIWKISKEELEELVKKCNTITEILMFFGLKNRGANNKTLKFRLKYENISIDHIKLGQNSNKGRKWPNRGLSLEECMQKVFIYKENNSKNTVKRYIKKYNLIPLKCAECKIEDLWNGKPLTLQLDHIDGNCNNDILNNLRWLCPNCHSQTSTYTGRANKKMFCNRIIQKAEKEKKQCKFCSNLFVVKQKPQIFCSVECCLKGKHKNPPLSKEDLIKLIWEFNIKKIALKFNVTSSTVVKWAKFYAIPLPPSGYWARRNAGYTHEKALFPRPKIIKGIKCKRKFSDEDISKIRTRISSGEKLSKIIKDYPCAHKTMRDIRDKKHI